MAISRTTAKTYFNTGDTPTETQFSDTLDAVPFIDDSTFTALSGTAWDGTYKTLTLTSNTALTFSSTKKSGVLIVTQDATGSRTLSIAGTAATINTAANSKTVISFIYNEVTSTYIFTIETNVIGNVSGGDTTAPTLVSATVENATPNEIELTYNEALDTGSVPSSSDYTPEFNATPVSVTGVSIAGSVVTLALGSSAVSTDVVTVDYTPGTNKLQDIAGNDAAALVNQSVTNNVSGGYDADAQAYITAEETAASITIPTVDKDAIDAFIVAVKGGANVWGQLKTLNFFYGTGLKNAKNLSLNYTEATNPPTIGAFGAVFDGTNDKLHSNIIPGTHLAASSESHGIYIKASTDDKPVLSVVESAVGSYMFPRSTGDFIYRLQDSSDMSGGANASAVGTYVVSIRSGGDFRAIKNGTQIHTVVDPAGTPPATYDVTLGCYNSDGGFSNFNAMTIGLYCCGLALTNTQMGELNTAIANFITATSRT